MLVISSLTAGASAQPFAPAETLAIDRLCLTTAAHPPSPLGLEIAATAIREHQAFGGHVIDRDGRMLRFGAVEADAFRDEAAGRGVPWRQVLRYWEALGPTDQSALQVRRFPGLADNAGASQPGDLKPLGELLDGLAQSSLPTPEREALVQAAIRSGLVDVPWSAAFVSHVVLTAGAARARFAAAIAHLDYVSEAARRSRDEAAGQASASFYRACDPRRTPMRPGDLLCMHRHAAAEIDLLKLTGPLFPGLAAGLARGERPVWNLHCDIVTGWDRQSRTATIIGGNVLQSVARRELRTDRRGALARARSGPACLDNREPGPLCRPESAPWFVLLQATDEPAP
ncbi:DUF2272 domain-containing protein [Phreatobacter stygius]|nr:DUF2272 domain-containing protein [Phreatobacter stygius]